MKPLDANPVVVGVAKALAASRGHNPHYIATFHDGSQTAVWEKYEPEARAALRVALQEPRDALLAALAIVWSCDDDARETGERMIRRALDRMDGLVDPFEVPRRAVSPSA
jgi:hypothetical protein